MRDVRTIIEDVVKKKDRREREGALRSPDKPSLDGFDLPQPRLAHGGQAQGARNSRCLANIQIWRFDSRG